MGVRSVSYVPGKLATLATFADLVAIDATTSSGMVYSITELNNAQFISDGTRWRPVGGQQLIAIKGDITTPVCTLTMTDFATGTNNAVDTTMALPIALPNYYDSFGWSIIAEPTILRSGVGSGGVALSAGIFMADALASVQGSAVATTAHGFNTGSIPAVVDQGVVWAQLSMFHLGTRKLGFTPFGLNAPVAVTRTSAGNYVKTTQQKFFMTCRTNAGVVSGDAFALQRMRLYLRA